MRTTITSALVGIAAVGTLAAGTSSAAATDIYQSGDHHTSTRGVVEGKLPFTLGNRHQLVLGVTSGRDSDPSTATGFVRSYYCPAGAGITHRWASSRCIHRSTHRAVVGVGGHVSRVSSTGMSAKQEGRVWFKSTVSSRVQKLDVDLGMWAASDPGDDWYRIAITRGTVEGLHYRSTDGPGGYDIYGILN